MVGRRAQQRVIHCQSIFILERNVATAQDDNGFDIDFNWTCLVVEGDFIRWGFYSTPMISVLTNLICHNAHCLGRNENVPTTTNTIRVVPCASCCIFKTRQRQPIDGRLWNGARPPFDSNWSLDYSWLQDEERKTKRIDTDRHRLAY
jgi:hypothetical protein